MNPDVDDLKAILPLLKALPNKFAVDVGSNIGEMTKFLAEEGFYVLALEPDIRLKYIYDETLKDLLSAGRVKVLNVAASDTDGQSEMYLADGISSLDCGFITTAFPDRFVGNFKKFIYMRTRKLSSLLSEELPWRIGFLKIDAEGCDHKVLKGLFDGSETAPKVVMFEACDMFTDRFLECLQILVSNGYTNFKAFIRRGPELTLSVEEFDGKTLPDEWRSHNGERFYANIVAQRGL